MNAKDAVVNPQALAPVGHQTELTQLRQVSGDVRLGRSDGIGQLADTELVVLHQQHEAAQTRIVGQSGEKFDRWIFMRSNIRQKVYVEK